MAMLRAKQGLNIYQVGKIFQDELLAEIFVSISIYTYWSSLATYLLLFPIDLRLSCVCVEIGTTYNIYVVIFLGWQAVISRFFQA